MRRPIRFSSFLLLFVSLATVKCLAANPPVRIMPLGDSITWGFSPDTTVQGGYRTKLYILLTNAGYNVNFVGTQSDTNPPAALPEPNHEGHRPYFEINQIDAGIDTWLAQVDDPDVVLLLIGTNDFNQGYDTTHATNRLENLIANIATARPYAKIIVANLLLETFDPNVDNAIQTLYNAYIPGVVAHQISLGRQVSFVDLRSCCGASDLSSDGVHPSLVGYDKVGQAWFPAVTNVIGPLGTTNPPAIAHLVGQVDLKHVLVTFSKPVAEDSVNLGDYSLSGGLSISQASLDSSKRVVTLTTSAQSTSTTYTLTVSGVKDRTAQQNVIAAGSTASFQSGAVAEAVNYSLVYSLKVPNQIDYRTVAVGYDVDNHGSVGAFSRVAYYLEMQPVGGSPQYMWASMDAFTTDPSKLGVPTIASGGFFQQLVGHMNVRSSVAGIVNGDGIGTGNMEFWWGDYFQTNAANVPGASSTLYDFGDSASPTDPAGYGSMQVHNYGARQTLFAFNGWWGGQLCDLGIGNSTGSNPDWTFAQNASSYGGKLLQVYVMPASSGRVLTVTSSNPGSGVSVAVSPNDNNGAGNGTTGFSRTYNSGVPVSLGAAPTAGVNTFKKWQKDGVDYVTTTNTTVTMDANHTMTAVYTTGALAPKNVAEAANYSLVYSLPIVNQVDYRSVPVGYEVDNHGSVGAFSRVGYYLELTSSGGTQWVWVSMDAFTTDPGKIGVPTVVSGGFFQRLVGHMNVRSSVAGIVSGDGITTGNMEFWWGDYTTANGANVPGASATVFDFGDSSSASNPGGYGSMQVHNYGAGQTLFAFNGWWGGQVCDLGIGNYSGSNPDWTFAQNASSYTAKTLQVYVLPTTTTPRTLTVASSNPGSGVGVTVTPNDNNGTGNGTTQFTRTYNSGASVTLTVLGTAGGNNFQKWQKDGVDYSITTNTTVTMDADHTMTAVYVTPPPVSTLTVASSNPASGVNVTVTPNDNNGAGNGMTQFTRTYNSGTSVTLKALGTAGGNNFQKWQKDGVDYSITTNTTVTMDVNHTMTTVYVTPPATSTLTVTSSNPGSGVSVAVSPNDNNGAGNGTTGFSRVYNNGVSVNLIAFPTAGVNPFKKWQKDGVDYVTTTNTTVTMDANHTMTAVYTTGALAPKNVAEAVNYSLVYSLPIVNQIDYRTVPVGYEVDNHGSVGAFSRVGYYLELTSSGGTQWVWVSMDAFTTDPGKIGVPTVASGGFFQQLVGHMNVRSSVAGIVSGDGITTGNMEFWWGDYTAANGANVPEASATVFDFGDSASLTDPAGYGSMQVHNYGARQTLFAFNGWWGGQLCDLGIGNSTGSNPDWTFAQNASSYGGKLLQVYVMPASSGRVLTVTSSNPGSGVSVAVSPNDNNGAGNGTTGFSRTYNSGVPVSLGAAPTAGVNTFKKWQKDGVDYVTTTNTTVTMDANHTMTAVYTTGALAPKNVAEAANYSLVYSLPIVNQVDYRSVPVGYEVDNHGSVGAFSRVGYYLELTSSGGTQWVWVSMDAFTTDPGKIGVPTVASGGFFQRLVGHMNVRSSVAGIVSGDGITTGNMEFWWGDYTTANGANVPGASATVFDFGDSSSASNPGGYGSMQVHNYGAGQTLFAFNGWWGGQVCDLGIGNYSGSNPDWTFAQNASSYTAKTLQVYVLSP